MPLGLGGWNQNAGYGQYSGGGSGGAFNISGLGGFGGRGGFSGGGFSQPPPVLYNPGAMNFNVQGNPQLDALQKEMADYRKGLAQGNNQDAILAMGRQRDLASGMAKEGLEGAKNAGFGSDTGYAQQRRLQGLNAGQQAAAGLNASLTSDARRQQLSALGQESGLALGTAGANLGQQNFLLNQWQAQQQAQQAAAQLQAMQQQNQFNNNLNLVRTYTGF